MFFSSGQHRSCFSHIGACFRTPRGPGRHQRSRFTTGNVVTSQPCSRPPHSFDFPRKELVKLPSPWSWIILSNITQGHGRAATIRAASRRLPGTAGQEIVGCSMFRVLCSRSSLRRISYQATTTARLRGLGDLATFPPTVTQCLFGKCRGGRPGVSGYLLL